jgi:hypothetical protein
MYIFASLVPSHESGVSDEESNKDFVVNIFPTCVWNLSCGLSYFETPNKYTLTRKVY